MFVLGIHLFLQELLPEGLDLKELCSCVVHTQDLGDKDKVRWLPGSHI